MAFDFTLVTSPFRMQPDLRRLEPGTRQLTASAIGDRTLREKLAVLQSFSGQALLATEGFDPSPALQALSGHAAQEHPSAWATSGIGHGHALKLGWSVTDGRTSADAAAAPEIGACLQALPAHWRLPALICLAFSEDFAVIDGRNGHIPWIAACLPSGWAPEEKIGRHFAEVHAPVADNQRIINASEQLVRLVTGKDRWERFVWSITRHPRLHAHPARLDPAPWPADVPPEELAQRAYLRTERQTFIPVPGHPEAVFTIRVELVPLIEAITTGEQAQRLHDALQSMSDAVLDYRSLTDARDRLLCWLKARAATP